MTAVKCEECGSEDEHDHAACLDRQLKNVRAELAAFGRGQALADASEPSHVFRPIPPNACECCQRRSPDALGEAFALRQVEGRWLCQSCISSDGLRGCQLSYAIRRSPDEPSLYERRKSTDAMCWRLVCIRLLLARSTIARHEKDRDHEIESFFAFCVELAKE